MTNLFFAKIIYLKSVPSTNTYLKENDLPDRSAAYTYDQTQGRGRNGKPWTGIIGKNLALSITLKPSGSFADLTWHVAACSLALTDILEEKKIKGVWIKWPNDVYINNKKIAGVLAETVWGNGKPKRIIIGIGVNVNAEKRELRTANKKAVSVIQVLKKEQNMEAFTQKLIERISFWYDALINRNDIEMIRSAWGQKCRMVGKKVYITEGNKKSSVKVLDITNEGELVVLRGKDRITVSSGEVTV